MNLNYNPWKIKFSSFLSLAPLSLFLWIGAGSGVDEIQKIERERKSGETEKRKRISVTVRSPLSS